MRNIGLVLLDEAELGPPMRHDSLEDGAEVLIESEEVLLKSLLFLRI